MRVASSPFPGADHDARLLLDAGARGFAGQLGLDLSGALFWDIDGPSAVGLSSVHDARAPIDPFIDTLELHATLDGWLQRASAGRFTVNEGAPITLDGGALLLSPFSNRHLSLHVFASAGRTVHFFEVDDDLFEDWAAS